MSAEHPNEYSSLDIVRINSGDEKCRTVFRETYETNEQKAIDLINDPKITFPCLFILMPQINSLNLHAQLNKINSIAVGIAHQITEVKNTYDHTDYFSAKNDTVHSALKWILQTGGDEYGLDDGYKKILDIAISVLINTYKDKSITPIVADMIFKRRKKEQNFYDLVWAFFRMRDLNALKLIAEHLLSPDREEAEFARNLLNIEAFIERDSDPQKQYKSYLDWLEENGPFLYFTGESHQFTSRPVMYQVDLLAKAGLEDQR